MTSFTALSILNLETTNEKIAGSNRMQIKSSHAIRATESFTPTTDGQTTRPATVASKSLCPRLPWPHIETSLLLTDKSCCMAVWDSEPVTLSTSVPPLYFAFSTSFKDLA